MSFRRSGRVGVFGAMLFFPLLSGVAGVVNGAAQQVAVAAPKPVTVEWVYRVKYGYKDEWWALFKKNQISLLERQKQLGYVKDYTVYAPSLHTSEDSRWDYRIIIVRALQMHRPGSRRARSRRRCFPIRTRISARKIAGGS